MYNSVYCIATQVERHLFTQYNNGVLTDEFIDSDALIVVLKPSIDYIVHYLVPVHTLSDN